MERMIKKKEIIMVTGGQRSGKSLFSEQLTLDRSTNPMYIATAEARDDEFRDRVRRHRARRGDNWTTIEAQTDLGLNDLRGRQVLVDCITMLATNYFFASGEDIDKALEAICADIDRLTAQDASFVFVTNEIGLGGISGNSLQRRFTDLLGFVNKYLAEKADTVYFMVSGIPLKIKSRD